MSRILLAFLTTAACVIPASQMNGAQPMGAQETPSQSVAGQDSHQPPAVLEIVVESVKEGRTGAHEKVEADWAAAFRKHKMPYQLTLTSLTGTNQAWFLIGHPSFAGVEEAEQMFEKPGIKSEMEMFDARDGELRTGTRTMWAVYRKDMSYHPDAMSVGKTRYVGITMFRPKLGHSHDFEEGSKKFVAAHEKAGLKSPALAYESVGGVSGDMYIYFEPMESLKGMDNYPADEKAVKEAMGEDEYNRMMNGAGDVFTSIEFNVYEVNPRMSYVSKETEDVDPGFWRPKPAVAKTATTAKPDKSAQ